MNKPLLAATLLMAVTFGVHTFVGGPVAHAPLLAADLPALSAAVASVVWHMITLTLAGFTLALAWMVRHPNRPMALLLGGLLVGYGLLFLGYGLAAFGNVTAMPQWSFFFAVPALIFWGSRSA